jgi:ribosomal protein L11 methyltransferase
MYWEAAIEGLPRTLEPALSFWLFKLGCWGTQEKLEFTQPDLRYIPKIKSRTLIGLSAYFDFDLKEEAEGQLYNWLKRRAPGARAVWHLQTPRDWLKEWKKHFNPLTVAGLKIVPSWKVTKKTNFKNTIVIEPGMAFGTGTHGTTRYAMELLSGLQDNIKGLAVLDVGSGSGILSVAAERLGADKILAIDNDPESWRECRKTFRLNKTKKCEVSEKQVRQIKSTHDITLANIIDGVLIDIKESLWRVTRKGGYIILSGILTDGASAFKKSFMNGRKGSRILKEISDEEWTALIILK